MCWFSRHKSRYIVSKAIHEFRRRDRFSFWTLCILEQMIASKQVVDESILVAFLLHPWSSTLFTRLCQNWRYNFYGTHANSNSQTCTHTQVEIRTPQNIHFCKLVVYHSHHSWVGDSLLWKNLVTVLESLVMDVIISRGLFPLFTVFSNFDVWHFCNNHTREVWWLPILGK